MGRLATLVLWTGVWCAVWVLSRVGLMGRVTRMKALTRMEKGLAGL